MVNEGETTGKGKTGKRLKKIAGISSWLLLVCVAVLIISGWGITQTGVIYNATGGLIDRRTADAIHRAVVFPLTFFFLTHVFINISLGIKSKHRYIRRIINWAFLVIGAGVLALVIYMEYFRLGG
jgi:hypothetical protein